MKYTLSVISLSTILLLHTNVLSAQGQLWGVTTNGGQYNAGVIFRTDADGTNYKVEDNFKTDPSGYGAGQGNHLTLASNGKFYGLLTNGGGHGLGVLFEYDPGNSTYTKKIDFDSVKGAGPNGNGLFAGTSGKLYGMTSAGGDNNDGVIFEYDPQTNTLVKKFSFSSAISGSYPTGDVVQASNGKLYGVTPYGGSNGGGVLFEYDPATNTYSKKQDFTGVNGLSPRGSLLLASNGKLYGMTTGGGVSGAGVLFEYDATTNAFTLKYSFGASGNLPVGSLIEGSSGKLYGMTLLGGTGGRGVLFEYNMNTNTYTKKYDFSSTSGQLPFGSLVKASTGNLFGMTNDQGPGGQGTLFEYNPTTNSLVNRFQFSNAANAGHPYGNLAFGGNGRLYGMVPGGSKIGGVLFEFDPTGSGNYQSKYEFSISADGAFPIDALTEASNSKLYGATSSGGANGLGALFEFDPLTNLYSKKFDFSSNDGSSPTGNLFKASNNKLYGLAQRGGSTGGGTIFEYDPIQNIFAKKFDFLSTTSGASVKGGLFQSSNGKLYGVFFEGYTQIGTSITGGGWLFEYDPIANLYSRKIDFAKDFTNTQGIFPTGGLVEASNSRLYGLTERGGTNDKGVIYEYDPASNTYTKKIDFPSKSGYTPVGSLVKASNGKLYGVTSGGGANGYGVLFEYDPVSGSYNERYDFNTATGTFPRSGLVESSNGKLYGLTTGGGSANAGVLYEYDPVQNLFKKRMDFTRSNGAPGSNRLIVSSQTITAIESNHEVNDLVIYPNPTKSNIYIKTPNWDDRYPISISIQDMTGKEICKSLINNGRESVEFYFGNLISGFYIVQARQGEKVIYKKIIKE
jgi:uncharacterized repeat protein (TIGR03803 family)